MSGGGRARAAPQTSASKRNARVNALVLGVLLVVLAFCGFLAFLKQNNQGGRSAFDAAPAPTPAQPARDAASRPPPKYDFYQDNDADTAATAPDAAVSAATAAAATTTAPAPAPVTVPRPSTPATAPQISLVSPAARGAAAPAAPASGFVVQAGAFNRFADADRRRAELLLLGFKARVEQGVADGSTVHRIRLGPFATSADAKDTQRRLQRYQISSFVQRVR